MMHFALSDGPPTTLPMIEPTTLQARAGKPIDDVLGIDHPQKAISPRTTNPQYIAMATPSLLVEKNRARMLALDKSADARRSRRGRQERGDPLAEQKKKRKIFG